MNPGCGQINPFVLLGIQHSIHLLTYDPIVKVTGINMSVSPIKKLSLVFNGFFLNNEKFYFNILLPEQSPGMVTGQGPMWTNNLIQGQWQLEYLMQYLLRLRRQEMLPFQHDITGRGAVC